jgi:hypothetical protein
LFPWALLVALGVVRVCGWLLQQRERNAVALEVLDMACQVRRIAGAFDAELTRLSADPRWRAYHARCYRLRQRADAALAHEDCVRRLSLLRLRRAARRFQRDVRKLKQCRLELRTEIARWGYARH